MTIAVLDLTPVGHYADGSPVYRFSPGGFPSRGVRLVGEVFPSKEDAYAFGERFVDQYRRSAFPGGMGCVLGVAAAEGGYRAVINTYYSNA